MCKKLVVGNFKMNLLKDEISSYIDEVKKYNFSNVIYCPSNIYLQEFINNNLCVGVQDVSQYESGSYTGDVSSLQLKSIGVKYALVGHSERRKYYSNEDIVDKVKLLIKDGIIPILCIGETKEEYNSDKTLDILKREIDFVFNKVDCTNLIIAYEPIWAIGTGLVPTNEEIHNTVDYIKKYIYEKYKIKIRVLYGGSVNNHNILELEKINNIDGYLIGGCSIKVKEFIELVRFINKD